MRRYSIFRRCLFATSLALVMVAGCRTAPKYDDGSGSSKYFFHNSRLKVEGTAVPAVVVVPYGLGVTAEGILVPVSKGARQSSDTLAFPEQTKINCYQKERFCHIDTLWLGAHAGIITIGGVDGEDIPIQTWTETDLIGERAAYPYGNDNDRCHTRTLTISLRAKTVFESDIPTGAKGCEAFTEINSYRLVSGTYFVDTTFNNDMPGDSLP